MQISTVRVALLIVGVMIVVVGTAAIESLALLWHRNFYWVSVPVATVVLYVIAWRRDPPLSSMLPRGLAAFIGAALAFEVLVLGLPLLALAHLVVGTGVAWGGSLLIGRLRDHLEGASG